MHHTLRHPQRAPDEPEQDEPTHDLPIEDPCEQSGSIIECQNQHGGWRYNVFTRDSDLSVTVCQLQALRAARNIGIRVPKTTIDRAVAYVQACQVPSGRAKGRYYYDVASRIK